MVRLSFVPGEPRRYLAKGTASLKIRLKTILLLVIPIAVFFAGVARPRSATVHIGMRVEEVATAMRLASAMEVVRPAWRLFPVQRKCIDGESTFWKLPCADEIVETVAWNGLVEVLHIDAIEVDKLHFVDRGAKIMQSNELTKDELDRAKSNRWKACREVAR